MITSFHLQNFQRHKDAYLEFVPGVNILAGSTDSGKSALIRGLLWAITNRPQGIDYRMWDCVKGDVVSAELAINGHTIKRHRSESVNEYYLDDQKFVAMRTDVPTDILTVVDMQAVNVQTQFQSHFLLASSAGEVARTFNDACNLSVIDDTMKQINGIAAKAKSDANAHTDLVESLTVKLAALHWVDGASHIMGLLESAQADYIDRNAQVVALLNALDSLQITQGKVQHMQAHISCFDALQDIPPLVQECEVLEQEEQALDKLLRALFVTECKQKDIPVLADDILADLQTQVDEGREIAQRVVSLQRTLQDLSGALSAIQNLQEDAASTQEELAALWGSVNLCPLCGNEVKNG